MRHSAFLPSRKNANLTIIQIKQLKRSYSRRLKFDLAFYVYQCHYTTCLQISTTRCQNQSTPLFFKVLMAFPPSPASFAIVAAKAERLWRVRLSAQSFASKRISLQSLTRAHHHRCFGERRQSYQILCNLALIRLFSYKYYSKLEL